MTTNQHFYRACVYCAINGIRKSRKDNTALSYLHEQKWSAFLTESWAAYKRSQLNVDAE